MADGSIRIDTKLNTNALKQQIKELERDLGNVQKEKAKTEEKLNKSRGKYDAEKEMDSQFPAEFSHRQEIDKRAAKELDPIVAKQEELNQKEQKYLAMLDAAKEKLAEQANLISASKQVDDTVKAESAVAKVRTQAEYNSLLDATRAKMSAIESAAAKVAEKTGVSKDKILEANPAYQRLSDTMSVLESKAEDFGNKGKRAAIKTRDGLKKANKEANGFGNAIKGGIKKVGKLALAVFGIRSAYNAVRKVVDEYLAQNEDLAGQLETLKGGFVAILAPAIEWCVGLFMDALSKVNAFVYALTGVNFIAKANETALNKQAKATKNLNKAMAQSAGFDEQTKLNDPSGGGSSSYGPKLLDDTIVEMGEPLSRIKEEWLAEDWYGVGKEIMLSLMQGICGFDWGTIGEQLGEVTAGLVAAILGLVLGFDVMDFYNMLIELVSGFVGGISTVIQNIDWSEVGKDLVDFIVKGALAALMFSTPLGPVAGWIITALLSPDRDELFSNASELIGSLIGALASALVGIGQGIADIAIWLWDTFKAFFIDGIDWGGSPGDIIAGLLEGIGDAIKGIGEWIVENIWNPFKEGFMKAFDMHSPSKKMAEFGQLIIDGLRNGIIGRINIVKQACTDIWEAIKEKFANVGTWFKDTFSKAWQKVKDVFSIGGKVFDGIKEGISSTFKTIVNGLIGGINKIISTPFKNINTMLNTIRSINILGVTPFKEFWSYNPLSIPQIPKLALGGIVNRPGRGVPAIIGEAGAEAVLPLENNTEWMDILAEKIGAGTITIPITLDGKKIATYVVDIQKKKAFAMNGA